MTLIFPLLTYAQKVVSAMISDFSSRTYFWINTYKLHFYVWLRFTPIQQHIALFITNVKIFTGAMIIIPHIMKI